jgi:hypothetical protein
MRRVVALATVSVFFAFSGCANILSVQEITLRDGGTLVGEDGAVIPDGVAECVSDADCSAKLPETVSGARCAEAKCRANRCVHLALDQDGDGLTVTCVSKDPQRPIVQSATIDCDDTAPGVVAGSEVDCTDGSFTLPGVGACRAGKKTCGADGVFSACKGVVGKQPAESCANNLDDDCDGAVNNGCTCSPGETKPCGVSAVGICQMGMQSCGMAATWGPCQNAIFPAARDCASAADNDCNGTVDSAEARCQCDMTAAIGSTARCSSGLAGICANGSKTCQANGSNAVWSGCRSPAPQARNCGSGLDNDCNGLGDNQETPCKCGIYFVGGEKPCPNQGGSMYCESRGETAAWNLEACGILE